MEDRVASKLLRAIELDQLVVLFGAGLSMAAPSSLPSGRRLAEGCAERYQRISDDLPADCRTDLEKLARFFYERDELEQTFISSVVDWSVFRAEPNSGHRSIADFLACHAIQFAITTNYDSLVERAADELGEPHCRTWIGCEDINRCGEHAPYIKIHGCVHRIFRTVWCVEQLCKEPLRTTIDRYRRWLEPQIVNREVLLVGFWSDWAYLNNAFAEAVVGAEPRSVTLVDPDESDNLRVKAPRLWNWANAGHVHFEHIKAYGEEFLDELRHRFSLRYVNRVVDAARPLYARTFGNCNAPSGEIPVTTSNADLYRLRRSFCGTPENKPVRSKRPTPDQEAAGVVHLFLVQQGATLSGGCYHLDGRAHRIISAPGRFLSAVKQQFSEEAPFNADVTICAGAVNDAALPNIVRDMSRPNIVRGGIVGEWITSEQALSFQGVIR